MLAKTALKPAMRGFLLWAGTVLLVLALSYLLAPLGNDETAKELEATFNEHAFDEMAWLIETKRREVGQYAILTLPLLGIYWLYAGAFCVQEFIASKAAATLLGLAMLSLGMMFLNDYLFWADTACDQLPFPHEGFQITRIYECPSSQAFFSTLFIASAYLMIVSLLVRIWSSRRRSS